MAQSRRTFVCNSGIGLLSFYVGGCELRLTPGQARQQALPFRVLSPAEVRTVDALGESLLPGSAAAGIAHFIDHQLNASPQDQLLMIRYLGVNPPFSPFYSGGLSALNMFALDRYGADFADLNNEQRHVLVGQIAQADPEGWAGPPAAFFYFVVRNDAVDVVYGTQQGVESLNIPYMAHIVPPSRWGE